MSTCTGGQERPLLFQIREPRRRFVVPLVLVAALHAWLIAWASHLPPRPLPPPEPVRVTLRLPPRKVPVRETPGGAPARPPPPARRHVVRRHIQMPRVIPPPVVEPPPPPVPEPEPPQVAEAEEAGDDDDGDGDPDGVPGGRGGGGSGTGTGTGTGPGTGAVKSKARGAWISHNDWKCLRPGDEDLGRIVVRIRVEVLPDGRPRRVVVLQGGPEKFNRRAVDCAMDETYLPALDPEGRPILGSAEFGIEFLN